jgi:ubiquinone/menaquinone biosynthesis C-methylase UbiE
MVNDTKINKRKAVQKFNSLAPAFSEREYANLDEYMKRRLKLAINWGKKLEPGDSVLELGCGDGHLLSLFAKRGYKCIGVDISPKMIEAAKIKNAARGTDVKFYVSDVESFTISEPVDLIISMRAFYSYVTKPMPLLLSLHKFSKKKVIIDVDPRKEVPLGQAVQDFKHAGFENVQWHPFFVPQKKKMNRSSLTLLEACEYIPIVRDILLKYKFTAWIRGEKI